jgi:hypothetical protein
MVDREALNQTEKDIYNVLKLPASAVSKIPFKKIPKYMKEYIKGIVDYSGIHGRDAESKIEAFEFSALGGFTEGTMYCILILSGLLAQGVIDPKAVDANTFNISLYLPGLCSGVLRGFHGLYEYNKKTKKPL